MGGWMDGGYDTCPSSASPPLPPSPPPAPPQVSVVDADTAIITPLPFSVHEAEGFDLETGRVLWRSPRFKYPPLTSVACTDFVIPFRTMYFGCACAPDALDTSADPSSDTSTDPSVGAGQWGGTPPPPRPTAVCGYAVDTTTGAVLWEAVLSHTDSFVPGAYEHGQQPLQHRDTIIFRTGSGVHAVGRLYGEVQWSFPLPPGQVIQPWDSMNVSDGLLLARSSALPTTQGQGPHTAAQTPPAAAQTLLAAARTLPGRIRAKLLGQAAMPASVPTQPLRAVSGWQATTAHVFALDAATGGLLWALSLSDLQSSSPISTPSQLPWDIKDGRVFFDGCDAAAELCCLYSADVETGALAWSMCAEHQRVCRTAKARTLGLDVIYALLLLQVVVVVGGFASVCVWRLCCRHRYLPVPTPVHGGPVYEVMGNDDASEEEER